MAETLKEPVAEENGEPARGRKTKQQPRKRRNFVAELTALQSRVDLALRILSRCKGTSAVDASLVDIAVETLKGDA